MKKAFAILLVLTLMTGLGYLIYTYTPNVAHQKFDARMNIQTGPDKEQDFLFIKEIQEELTADIEEEETTTE